MKNPDALIRRWLEAALDNYLQDLAALVNRDCGTAYKQGVDEVADWVEARMRELGTIVERREESVYGDILLARWPGQGSGRVLLSGHMDTVYPIGTAALRPMHASPDDPDHLLGPGITDMKSGLLSGIYAIAALRALGLDRWEEVALICNSEEEVGSPVSRPWLVELAGQYDAALVLEAGRANGDVVTGRKGGGHWRIIVEGKAAHAGVEPEKGANAIIQLAHHALALDAINGTIPGATVVVGTTKGGEVPNMVPPHAEMTVDTRALDPVGLEALDEAVRAALTSTEGRVPGTRTIIEGGIDKGTMPRTEANLRLFAIARESAAAQGFTIGEQVSGGTSDGNFLATGGIPVLDGLGPVGGLDHSPDEYLRRETVVPRTAMLAGLIYRLSNGNGE
ncbi:MAG TPA: M20 family metallopeptidase [Ardenticatenaceae bacterium]|jgi:glutamate carboxypeptidase